MNFLQICLPEYSVSASYHPSPPWMGILTLPKLLRTSPLALTVQGHFFDRAPSVSHRCQTCLLLYHPVLQRMRSGAARQMTETLADDNPLRCSVSILLPKKLFVGVFIICQYCPGLRVNTNLVSHMMRANVE